MPHVVEVAGGDVKVVEAIRVVKEVIIGNLFSLLNHQINEVCAVFMPTILFTSTKCMSNVYFSDPSCLGQLFKSQLPFTRDALPNETLFYKALSATLNLLIDNE